jgi:hypothetical protein
VGRLVEVRFLHAVSFLDKSNWIQTKKLQGDGKTPELFYLCITDSNFFGEVRFCFPVTLLVSWTGKAEFCDPRKITGLCGFLSGVSHSSEARDF